MRSVLPPLDLHAHIDVGVPEDALRSLSAVIFVATRSLAEARQAQQRQDDMIVWGVGSHPGLARSHNSFDSITFRSLIEQSCLGSAYGAAAYHEPAQLPGDGSAN
jgi:TatD DNase family protein